MRHGAEGRSESASALYFVCDGRILPLIEHNGYLIVFFGVMVGTMGIPFPSAAILLAAGVLVQQGHLDLRYAILFGILGAIVGNQIGYWVGHKGGRQFVLKWGALCEAHPRAPGASRATLRSPRRQGRLRSPFLLGHPHARSARSRHQPHALGHFFPLQCAQRNGLGYGGCLGGVLFRSELDLGGTLVRTRSPLALLLGVALGSSYRGRLPQR